MQTYILGHRGASGAYPENTIASFQGAINMHADGVEFDVQLSKDGKPIVIHDELLDRTTNGSGLVKDYTLSEIRKLDAGKYYSHLFQSQKIPTLNEVLAIVQNLAVINIELKNFYNYPRLEEEVLQSIKSYDIVDKTIISSFNHHSLLKFKDLEPEVKTGALLAARLIDPVKYCKSLGADAIHAYYLSITPEIIKNAHQNGLQVNVFTVNKESEIIYLLKEKVDMIITDYPDQAKSIIKKQEERS